MTPLLIAVQQGNQSVVEKLIKLGADINSRSPNGRSVLHFAVKNGKYQIFKMFIDLKVDVNLTDNE
jgi:ankyrin repeat protein